MAAFNSPITVQWSQLGCLLFDLTPPRAFDFDQKLTEKVAQIILYYQVKKKISSLLELIDHVLSISEYVLE